MAKASLLCLSLGFVLLFNGCLARQQSQKSQQQEQSQCQIRAISALEPLERVQAEAGYAERLPGDEANGDYSRRSTNLCYQHHFGSIVFSYSQGVQDAATDPAVLEAATSSSNLKLSLRARKEISDFMLMDTDCYPVKVASPPAQKYTAQDIAEITTDPRASVEANGGTLVGSTPRQLRDEDVEKEPLLVRLDEKDDVDQGGSAAGGEQDA